MKKLLLFVSVLTASVVAHADEPKDSVLICTGSASKTYHTNPDCKGIESCTKQIILVAKKDVEKKRRFCKRCQHDMDRIISVRVDEEPVNNVKAE